MPRYDFSKGPHALHCEYCKHSVLTFMPGSFRINPEIQSVTCKLDPKNKLTHTHEGRIFLHKWCPEYVRGRIRIENIRGRKAYCAELGRTITRTELLEGTYGR